MTSLPIKRVDKGWGYELWIANSELYCGKLLFFEKDKKCSLHYHVDKDETFFLQSGKIILAHQETLMHDLMYKVMFPGDSHYIPPGTIHQMVALEDSELFEFSTQHFDSDSYRIEKGD